MGRCWGQAASHLPQRTQWLGLFGIGEAGFPLVLDGLGLAEHPQLVPDAEVVRDVHAHGAGHTVAAAGAADLDPAVQDGSGLFHGLRLFGGKRLKMLKRFEIIFQLVFRAHAGKDDMDILVAAHQRSAQEAALASGRRALRGASASGGRVARVPPLMGSMMMRGMFSSSVN